MCYNGGPSRRSFATLLAAGVGMAALAACTPDNRVATPTSTPSPSGPAPTPAAATTTAVPSAAPSDQPPSGAPPSKAPSAALSQQFSHSDPASQWVIVNKHRPLSPLQFVPADLVQPRVQLAVSGEASLLNSTTATAAEKLFAAATSAGVTLTLASGYRSFQTQTATYNGYASTRGQASADTASARPGFSEHQTGWAFDIGDGGGACSFEPCFADQPAAVWAKANAYKFGFVVRYPWMLNDVTGYYYEPWHLRFIGIEAATDMSKRGIGTLEEYFGLEAAPGYL
ncbi:M15 family metallopeptidase [Arthrobacter bambusae]|uniref:M15 family metallopeptidase n=1 Tax=Arthrobacter bambusae TaxID=1338426 RepID=UPI0027837713|nr:M15 family metallopeptidase [Arthrobacter bambusae]MDQ0211855.1 D-alanyl-D-alanine carboxypeptidase [Arthrobacter bambusae]MDQ0236421.1 D-alanyl-D-alanine carboxypeptidase [Arthrobacter bambusae]